MLTRPCCQQVQYPGLVVVDMLNLLLVREMRVSHSPLLRCSLHGIQSVAEARERQKKTKGRGCWPLVPPPFPCFWHVHSSPIMLSRVPCDEPARRGDAGHGWVWPSVQYSKWKGASKERRLPGHTRDAFFCLLLTQAPPFTQTTGTHPKRSSLAWHIKLEGLPVPGAASGRGGCSCPRLLFFFSSAFFLLLEGCVLDGQADGRLDPCSSIGVRLLAYQTCVSAMAWLRTRARRMRLPSCPIERGRRLRVALAGRSVRWRRGQQPV